MRFTVKVSEETMKALRRVKRRTKQPFSWLIQQAVEKAYGNGAVVGATVDKKG